MMQRKKKIDQDNFAVAYLQSTAAITFIIGIVLLFWPERILQWFIPEATGDFFIRFIGSTLVGYSTLNYLASRSGNLRTCQIAIDANLVTLGVASLLSIIGVTSGTIRSYEWLIIAEHVFFFALFVWARILIKSS